MAKTPSALRRAVALLLLIFSFVLCGAPATAQAITAPALELEHPAVHFSQMGNGSYDRAVFEALLSDFSAAAASRTAREQMNGLTQALLDELDVIETQYVLSDIYLYLEVDNPDRVARQEEMRVLFEDCRDLALAAISQALNGPHEQLVASLLGDTAPDFYDYQPMTDADRELARRENDLIQQYYALTEALTEQDIGDIDYLVEAGSVFLALRDLRVEIAEASGYDSYADLASQAHYGRTYGRRDIYAFCQNLRADLTAATDHLHALYQSRDVAQTLAEIPPATPDQLMTRLGAQIKQLSPTLLEAYRHLSSFGLYDIDARAGKAQIGFTTSLPQYNTAFLFDSPVDSSVQNLATLFHEFGHFSADHFNPLPSLLRINDYDLFELQSQGLELLMLDRYPDLYGKVAEDLVLDHMLGLLLNILYYGYLSELELSIYGNTDWTLEDISRQSAILLEEYGLSYDTDVSLDSSWLYDNHLMTSPLYGISYSVSGLAALDLWRIGQSDRTGAVDTYLALLSADTSIPFRERLQSYGIQDVFAKGSTTIIATALTDHFEQQEQQPRQTVSLAGRSLIPLILIYLLAFLFGIWVRNRRSRAER